MRVSWMAVAALGVSLSGCMLEPVYHRPTPAVAATWPEALGMEAGNRAAASQIGWRDFFIDARLQKLIEQALLHNPDAQVAALNIAAARAQYQVQRAELFPTISASALEEVEKSPTGLAGVTTAPAAGGTGGTGGTGGAPAAGGTATPAVVSGSGVLRFFNAGVGFTSYEVDVFGRIRSMNHARLQQYLGYVETRRSTQISVVAEVANAYLSLLADQLLLRITRDTLDSQRQSLKLVKMSFEGGVDTALDLHQAETTVATAQANLAQYARQVAQDENALVLLLGAPVPDELPEARPLDEEMLLATPPPEMPADVLTQRPDILAAEHNLIAANASIGAARAAFFPSIALTGNYGTESTQLSGLFAHGSTAWSFSPQISLPIFAAGANIGNLKLAKAQRDILLVQYQQAIQTGFREVADALAGRATLDDQVAADQALVDASSESFRLSNMRFSSGVDNYLGVLDSQRLLYGAQQSLVNIKLTRLQNLVTLYKATGGGWRERSGAPSAP